MPPYARRACSSVSAGRSLRISLQASRDRRCLPPDPHSPTRIRDVPKVAGSGDKIGIHDGESPREMSHGRSEYVRLHEWHACLTDEHTILAQSSPHRRIEIRGEHGEARRDCALVIYAARPSLRPGGALR